MRNEKQMKTTKTSNRKARRFVQDREPFTGSNTSGGWEGKDTYVVYSYGRHWPLFIWAGWWYENAGRYSVTTSKHSSQLHPGVETRKLSCPEMRALRDKA